MRTFLCRSIAQVICNKNSKTGNSRSGDFFLFIISPRKRLHVFKNGQNDVNDVLESFVCLCWGFTAQSTQWGHVERGQFTNHTFTGQA